MRRLVWILFQERVRKEEWDNKVKMSQWCCFYKEAYSVLNIEKLWSDQLICMWQCILINDYCLCFKTHFVTDQPVHFSDGFE